MFVDTISAINVNNGIVKMNLVAQSSEQPITDDNNPPKFDDLGQITMPLNGFPRLRYRQMNQKRTYIQPVC
jgi:hypothetical protein